MLDTYLDRVYLDSTGDHAALAFTFQGEGDWEDVDLTEIRALIEKPTPENRSSTGVRVGNHWWTDGDSNPGPWD